MRGADRWIRVPGVADFRVTDGVRVDVARAPGAEEAEVLACVEGRATAAILQQRGTHPLHVAAVVIDGHAVGFVGPPGAGKSSIACALVDRGRDPLTDDLGAVAWDDRGRPVLVPGPPRLRVWGDSARQLGRPTDDALRVAPGADKYAYPMTTRMARRPHRLGAVYVLVPGPGSGPRVHAVRGIARFETYFTGATYGRDLVDTPQARAWLFEQVCRLATAVPTFALELPAGALVLADLADAVEAHAGSRRGRGGRR
jgi:hypothetical protein